MGSLWRCVLLLVVAVLVTMEAASPNDWHQFLPTSQDNLRSRGNIFYVGFMENLEKKIGEQEKMEQGNVTILVSTEEPGPVSFRVVATADGGINKTYTATYGSTTKIVLGDTFQVLSDDDREKGILVQAEYGKTISVHGINDEFRSTDGFLALSCDGMNAGTNTVTYTRYEYLVLSGDFVDEEGKRSVMHSSELLIIPCEDDTDITIYPSQNITYNFGGGDRKIFQGQNSNWNGNAGETYLIAHIKDLSGTIIRSDKPVVVYAGHQCAQVPKEAEACDHLVEQIPPHTTWGRTHLLNPLAARASEDIYRVGTVYDNTQVTVTCVDEGSNTTETLISNRTLYRAYNQNWLQFPTHDGPNAFSCSPFTRKYCCVETTKPVLVIQYSQSYSADNRCRPDTVQKFGDPFTVLIPPAIHYLNNYTISTIVSKAGPFNPTYINIAVHEQFFQPHMIKMDGDTVEADGTQWNPFYCSGGEICGYGISKEVVSGDHTVYHEMEDAALGVSLYGFQQQNSFGFPVGMELQPVSGTVIECTCPGDCTFPENVGTITITCTRTLDIDIRSDISVRTVHVEATEPMDYIPLDLIIPYRGRKHRETFKSFNITIVDDSDAEGDEAFEMTVTPIRNVIVLTPVIRVTILCDENDGACECPSLMDPDNGQINLTATSPGSIATYHCYEGCKLNGEQTRTCQSNGTWTGQEPICTCIHKAYECQRLVDPDNGQVHLTGTSPGSIATYTCYEGCKLNGEQTRTCQSNGNWTAQEPTCNCTTKVLHSTTEVSVGFDPTTYFVNEGVDSTVSLRVIKTESSDIPVTATVTILPGSAEYGTDYTGDEVKVTFQPGEIQIFVDVNILDDDVLESVETFTATLTSDDPNVAISSNDTARVTITDNDRVSVGFNSTTYSVTEGKDGSVSLTVVKTGIAAIPVTAIFTTLPDSAEDGTDYTDRAVTLTFQPGEVQMSVSVNILDDDILEDVEMFSATLTTADHNVDISSNDAATITITDNDRVSVGFNLTTNSATEGVDSSVALRVVKTGMAAIPVTAVVTTVPGTAEDGTDYGAVVTTVTFEPGDTEQLVDISILNDDVLEGVEMFNVTLTTHDPKVDILLDDTSVVTITDDDSVQVAFVPASYSVLEGNQVSLTVVKTGETAVPITVNLSTAGGTATAGVDYEELTGVPVVFAPGVNTQTVTLTTLNDSVADGNETLTATITTTQSGVDITVPQASITIVEILDPQLSFTSDNYEVVEGELQVEVCLMLNAPLAEDLSVTLTSKEFGSATGGGIDFTEESRVVTFTAGETESCTDFAVVDDSLALEGDETFVVDFEVPPGLQSETPSSTTVTIIDDDQFVVSFSEEDYSYEEGNSEAQVCLTGEGEIAREATATVSSVASGTAQEGLDYEPVTGATVTFVTGTSTQDVCIPLTLIDDIIKEIEEFFHVKIDSVSEGSTVGSLNVSTVRITDNDGAVFVNDSVIADPQYTVSLPENGSEALCYEVHGSANDYYNIISDTCTSVNAYYTAIPGQPHQNRISTIGIHAVIDEGATLGCTNIQIDHLNCAASVDGNVVNTSISIGDIRMKKINNRWRVSVPNCRRLSSVMWVTCEARWLRFDVVRGSGLRPTSHGLLGQFWNIPMTVSEVEGSTYIEVYEVGDSQYRRFPVLPYPQTWDHTYRRCHYAGNVQGGPEKSRDPSESIIEGSYTQYQTTGLFDTTFDYKQFNDSLC